MLHRRKNPSKFFHECVVKQDGECRYCKYSDERLFGKWHDHEFIFHVVVQNINRFDFFAKKHAAVILKSYSNI